MSLSYLQYAYRYSGSAKGRFVNLKIETLLVSNRVSKISKGLESCFHNWTICLLIP
jgi:hypothetical protein